MLSKDKTVRHPAGAAFAIRTGLQTIFLELPVKRLYARAVVPDQAHFAREEGKPLMDFAELAGTCLREREDELAYVTDLAKLRQHLLHRGFVKFAMQEMLAQLCQIRYVSQFTGWSCAKRSSCCSNASGLGSPRR